MLKTNKVIRLTVLTSIVTLSQPLFLPIATADELTDLKTRIEALEGKSEGIPLSDRISISGAVEVEYSQTNSAGFSGRDASDLVVATVALAIEAKVTDQVIATIGTLFEEDDTPFEIDEAFLSIDINDTFSTVLGQQYLPFGVFETAMVNDTLVLELAETRETAALLQYEMNGLTLAGYLFNGDVDKGKDEFQNYGINFSYERDNYVAGVGYISNAYDTDGISDFIGAGTVTDVANAMIVNASATFGTVVVMGEYVKVDNTAAFTIEPKAFQLEVLTELNNWTFAASYQETDESVLLGLPEKRLSFGASTEVLGGIGLGIEFWQDEDYSIAKGGSGKDASNIIVQLAAEF